jgi:23S rRNA (adenine2503-C2)-methyltransferase
MGDSGRNMDAVGEAVAALTCRNKFSMASSKITISTVGPSPEAFTTLSLMPGTLAWSLHSADDKIRRKLVPSTRHSTVELRDGLVKALKSRKAVRTRTIMIALTLIDGVNDSEEDAIKLTDFIAPMLGDVPKIAIDLIPYNDISVPEFKKPSKEKVNAFQKVVREAGYFCTVRVTRGEDESSACGMLATKRLKKDRLLLDKRGEDTESIANHRTVLEGTGGGSVKEGEVVMTVADFENLCSDEPEQ